MSILKPSTITVKPVYADSGDRTGLLVTESIMLLSVLGGVGSLPFLKARGLSWYWMVTLAAGILTILAGIWYASRQWLRANRPQTDLPKGLREQLADLVVSLPPALRSVFTWRSSQPVLPRFAVLTGVLILFPALASWGLERMQHENAHLFEIYFCTPAFLVWMSGAGYYAFPILNIRPKHGPQIAGLVKSGLQALSALLLWVYLGLSVGLLEAHWMFWSALALALIGGLLGIPASAVETDSAQAGEGDGAPGGKGTQQVAAPGS